MSDYLELSDAAHKLFNFVPPGPVAQKYMMATDPISLIMGPMGSGKTTSSVFTAATQSLRMPICADGVVRAKGCVVRDNYRTLYRTTLPSWFNFFPKDFPGSDFEGGQDRPAKHTIRYRTPRGTPVEMIVEFFAIGDQAIEELLKGWEGSWAWMNEADLLDESVPGFLYSRLARYPSRALLRNPEAILPRRVFGDLNPPPVDHWIYINTQEAPQPGWALYKQPSGLSDQAENRAGVPRAYYEELARTLKKAEVRRFVHGEWGYSSDGLPVYEDDFRPDLHIVDDLPVDPHFPLHAGLDQGYTPAFVPFQEVGTQLRFPGEYVPGSGVGVGRFVEGLLGQLHGDYRECELGKWFADPAGFYGADRQAGELAWAETVAQAIGHRIDPAPSQEPALRSEALRIPLRTIGGALFSRRARMLVAGLAAHFKFPKRKVGGRTTVDDRWEKNAWSHPVEAAQYGVLGYRGTAGIIAAAAKAGRAGKPPRASSGTVVSADFDVMRA